MQIVPPSYVSRVITKPVLPYANNKDADQPAHPRSLISAFVVLCLDSMIPLVSIFEISSLHLVSVDAQTGLSRNWSETPKTGFLETRLMCIQANEVAMSYTVLKGDLIGSMGTMSDKGWSNSRVFEPRHEKTCSSGFPTR